MKDIFATSLTNI